MIFKPPKLASSHHCIRNKLAIAWTVSSWNLTGLELNSLTSQMGKEESLKDCTWNHKTCKVVSWLTRVQQKILILIYLITATKIHLARMEVALKSSRRCSSQECHGPQNTAHRHWPVYCTSDNVFKANTLFLDVKIMLWKKKLGKNSSVFKLKSHCSCEKSITTCAKCP